MIDLIRKNQMLIHVRMTIYSVVMFNIILRNEMMKTGPHALLRIHHSEHVLLSIREA